MVPGKHDVGPMIKPSPPMFFGVSIFSDPIPDTPWTARGLKPLALAIHRCGRGQGCTRAWPGNPPSDPELALQHESSPHFQPSWCLSPALRWTIPRTWQVITSHHFRGHSRHSCHGNQTFQGEIPINTVFTLWWTNIAIENGHRNSGFSH